MICIMQLGTQNELDGGERMKIMAIWVVEFSNGGYKIRKIFA